MSSRFSGHWAAACVTIAAVFATGNAGESGPLKVVARIPLGSVTGRIDHMVVDLDRQRLFVAELGNDSVGVVDLKSQKILRTLIGLKEPQGLAYVPGVDSLYVANAGDGSVRVFHGADLSEGGRLPLGADADNVRIDARRNQILVGFGSGGLAFFDATTARADATVALQAHPESFQIDASGGRAFVNVPDAREIAVVDLVTRKAVAHWSTGKLYANFPMALDEKYRRVLVVFRKPAVLGAFDMTSGAAIDQVKTCEDADDIFLDSRRQRIYISCGEGVIDTFAVRDGRYEHLDRTATVAGARTALFVPELDRLFLAVRSTLTQPAAIWVLQPP
jgi:hypothetical protein